MEPFGTFSRLCHTPVIHLNSYYLTLTCASPIISKTFHRQNDMTINALHGLRKPSETTAPVPSVEDIAAQGAVQLPDQAQGTVGTGGSSLEPRTVAWAGADEVVVVYHYTTTTNNNNQQQKRPRRSVGPLSLGDVGPCILWFFSKD